jgi:uncharacterized membrane protein
MKHLNKIGLGLLGLVAAAPAFAEQSGITPITVDESQLTVGTVLANVTTWVLGFSAAVAVLFLIVGGLQYITAAGNEKRSEAAKSTILYAVIGLVVILLSFVIVGFLKVNIGQVVK